MIKKIYSTPLHGVECFVYNEHKTDSQKCLPLYLKLRESSIALPSDAVSVWQHTEQGSRHNTRFTIYTLDNGSHILDVNCEGAGRFHLFENDIEIDWQAGGTDSTHYFQTVAIAVWLELKDVLCIHANALEYGDKTVALIGPSGMGKSTLSSFCLSKGFNWLTDDMLALHFLKDGLNRKQDCNAAEQPSTSEMGFYTYPSWPVARMWVDSIDEVVKQDSQHLKRVHEKFNKREISVPKVNPEKARKLNAIYILNRHDAELNNQNPIFKNILSTSLASNLNLVKLDPSSATIAIIQNSMLGEAYKGLGIEHKRFQGVTQLVNTVPVYIINYESDFNNLSTVYELLLDSMSSLN